MDLQKSSSAKGSSFTGIDDSTEKLFTSYNIPMDCYLLTNMIAIHFNRDKFYKYFFKKNTDKFNIYKLLSFLSATPVIFAILSSGIIVFLIQLYILISFVVYELEMTTAENTENLCLRLILIFVFSMLVMQDYQTGLKKIAIGFKMMSHWHKFATISLSFIQCSVTLIVLTSSILLIKITDEIDDLLQNFMALYVIIQINDIMFIFLGASGILNGLKVLGFKSGKIDYFHNIKSLWTKNKSIFEGKDKEMKISIEKRVLIGQVFFYAFTIGITVVIFVLETETFF